MLPRRYDPIDDGKYAVQECIKPINVDCGANEQIHHDVVVEVPVVVEVEKPQSALLMRGKLRPGPCSRATCSLALVFALNGSSGQSGCRSHRANL